MKRGSPLNEEVRELLAPILGRRVYAIQIGDDGPIKIGVTTDVSRRLWTLQTACPWDLHLRAEWAAEWSSETTAHHELARHRMRGEWFTPHAAVLAYIRNRGGA